MFGFAVAINGAGNRIAIGARHDSFQGTQNGAAYIYARVGTTWSYKHRVLPSDWVAPNFRYFGRALALSSSGDTLVVSAYGEGSNIGGWRHYEWNGAQFNQVGARMIGQPAIASANQGYSIAMSSDGQTVIGLSLQLSPLLACPASRTAGCCFFLPTRADVFLPLSSCALCCCVLVSVGASGTNERSAYVWSRNVSGSTDWQQLSKLTDVETGSGYGASVALSGSTMEIVVGGQQTHLLCCMLQRSLRIIARLRWPPSPGCSLLKRWDDVNLSCCRCLHVCLSCSRLLEC
jgi:hypothetical protein